MHYFDVQDFKTTFNHAQAGQLSFVAFYCVRLISLVCIYFLFIFFNGTLPVGHIFSKWFPHRKL